MMKKALLTLILAALASFILDAQTPRGELVDSLVFVPVAAVDTTLSGTNFYTMMPSNVTVDQTSAIDMALYGQIYANEKKQVNGYRIRIFFDNGQNSRRDSEAALNRFKNRYPTIAAYRTFTSPYFKVTVGDYRTKSEAIAALKSLQGEFPSAFIVREKFRFPVMDGDVTIRVDTLKVRR